MICRNDLPQGGLARGVQLESVDEAIAVVEVVADTKRLIGLHLGARSCEEGAVFEVADCCIGEVNHVNCVLRRALQWQR